MTTAPAEVSPRAQIRRYVAQYIKDESEIEIPTLVSDVVEHFSEDKPFIKALVEQTLRETVYMIAREVVQGTRGEKIWTGEEILDRKTLERRAKKQSVFANWLRARRRQARAAPGHDA